MKNKIISGLALILAAFWLFTSCETDMEKAQNDYSASKVIPKVLSVSGTTLALQTFSYTYKIGYSRAGSTWTWSAEGATIISVSVDTKTASVSFPNIPSGGKAKLTVIETTVGGVASEPKVIEIAVNPFCPLAPSGFVGAWTGTDGMDLEDYFFDSEIEVANATSTTIKVSGINAGWIANVWGEEIIDGGTVTMTIGNDGTGVIEDQYLFTTLNGGDPYVYRISGTATWDNCGSSPTMLITYVIYYESDGYTLPGDWAGEDFPAFYADITLGTKGSGVVRPEIKTGSYNFPPKSSIKHK